MLWKVRNKLLQTVIGVIHLARRQWVHCIMKVQSWSFFPTLKLAIVGPLSTPSSSETALSCWADVHCTVQQIVIMPSDGMEFSKQQSQGHYHTWGSYVWIFPFAACLLSANYLHCLTPLKLIITIPYIVASWRFSTWWICINSRILLCAFIYKEDELTLKCRGLFLWKPCLQWVPQTEWPVAESVRVVLLKETTTFGSNRKLRAKKSHVNIVRRGCGYSMDLHRFQLDDLGEINKVLFFLEVIL